MLFMLVNVIGIFKYAFKNTLKINKIYTKITLFWHLDFRQIFLINSFG